MAESTGEPNENPQGPVEPGDPLAPFGRRDGPEVPGAQRPPGDSLQPPPGAYARPADDPDDIAASWPEPVSMPGEAFPGESPAEFEQPGLAEPQPLPIPPPISAPTAVNVPPASPPPPLPPPGMQIPPMLPPAGMPPPPVFARGSGQPPELPPAGPPPGSQPGDRFPAWFDVEYRQPLSRLTTFFRIFLLVPLFLLIGFLTYAIQIFVGVARLGTFFRRKYPVWMYSANAGFLAWHGRCYAYALLLTDQFPSFSTEPQNAVKLGYDVPEPGNFSRWNGILSRVIVCIPHFIVLGFLFTIVVPIVALLAWFAILFTGRYPQGMFRFVTGVLRWWFRVTSYMFLLHDRFPPFSTSAAAVRSGQGAITASAIGGGLLAAGSLAAFAGIIVSGNQPYIEDVDYARLADGSDSVTTRLTSFADDEGPAIEVTLAEAFDPGDDFALILLPARDERIVVFEWDIRNRREQNALVDGGVAWFTVEYENDDGDLEEKAFRATLVTVTNTVPPVNIRAGGRVFVYAVFVIPIDSEPISLRFRTTDSERPIRYEFD